MIKMNKLQTLIDCDCKTAKQVYLLAIRNNITQDYEVLCGNCGKVWSLNIR